MTITREQLELAALAAGHAEARYESWPGMAIRHGYTCAIWTGDCYINPAESIADAARERMQSAGAQALAQIQATIGPVVGAEVIGSVKPAPCPECGAAGQTVAA